MKVSALRQAISTERISTSQRPDFRRGFFNSGILKIWEFFNGTILVVFLLGFWGFHFKWYLNMEITRDEIQHVFNKRPQRKRPPLNDSGPLVRLKELELAWRQALSATGEVVGKGDAL